MAKIMTPEQFRLCQPGTVFAFGEPWTFSGLLILEEIIDQLRNGIWGFWATDPMWPESEGCGPDEEILQRSLDTGEPFEAQKSCTKYMSYDGDKMDVFLVLDVADWEEINLSVNRAFNAGSAIQSGDKT